MIIGRLTGIIAGIGVDSLLIDVNGVGYVTLGGTRLLSSLKIGDQKTLAIETKVSEANIQMFAFGEESERAWFVRLQDVHGVAGKAALAILDSIPPSELAQALALGDSAALMRAKGVGKKLADRIVTELGGKAPPLGWMQALGDVSTPAKSAQSTPASPDSTDRAGAVSALVNLGYESSDAIRAVAEAQAKAREDLTLGAWIKAALKEASPHG